MSEAYIPSSTGMGQGLAQVINLQPLVNLYGRVQQMKAQRAQADAMALRALGTSVAQERAGLRVQDIPEYNAAYNKMKDIYINNKGLYSNPASNMAAYQEAEAARQQMSTIAAGSKQLKDVVKQGSTLYSQKPHAFEDGSLQTLQDLNNLPVSHVLANYGEIPSGIDFMRFKPEKVDVSKYVKNMQTLMDHGGGYDMIPKTVTWKEDTRLPEGKENYWQDKVYKPDAILANYKTMVDLDGSGNLEKYYQNGFETATPEEINKKQNFIDDLYGKQSFKITDPTTFAAADIAQNWGRVSGADKAKLQNNAGYVEQQKIAAVARQKKKEEDMAYLRDRLIRARPPRPRVGGARPHGLSPADELKLDDNKVALLYRASTSNLPDSEGLPTFTIIDPVTREHRPYLNLTELIGGIKISPDVAEGTSGQAIKRGRFIKGVLKDPASDDGLVLVLNQRDDLTQLLGRTVSNQEKPDPQLGGYLMHINSGEATKLMKAVRTQNGLKQNQVDALQEMYGPAPVAAEKPKKGWDKTLLDKAASFFK